MVVGQSRRTRSPLGKYLLESSALSGKLVESLSNSLSLSLIKWAFTKTTFAWEFASQHERKFYKHSKTFEERKKQQKNIFGVQKPKRKEREYWTIDWELLNALALFGRVIFAPVRLVGGPSKDRCLLNHLAWRHVSFRARWRNGKLRAARTLVGCTGVGKVEGGKLDFTDGLRYRRWKGENVWICALS